MLASVRSVVSFVRVKWLALCLAVWGLLVFSGGSAAAQAPDYISDLQTELLDGLGLLMVAVVAVVAAVLGAAFALLLVKKGFGWIRRMI